MNIPVRYPTCSRSSDFLGTRNVLPSSFSISNKSCGVSSYRSDLASSTSASNATSSGISIRCPAGWFSLTATETEDDSNRGALSFSFNTSTLNKTDSKTSCGRTAIWTLNTFKQTSFTFFESWIDPFLSKSSVKQGSSDLTLKSDGSIRMQNQLTQTYKGFYL